METLTLRPSVPKILPYTMAFGLIGLAGALMAKFFGHGDLQHYLLAWFLLNPVIVIPIIILSLTPLLFYYRLQPTGLQMRFLFRRTSVFPWSIIERVGRWDGVSGGSRVREHVALAFNFSSIEKGEFPAKPRPVMTQNRQKTGGLYDLLIPIPLGMETDKIVAVLNKWRIRYSI